MLCISAVWREVEFGLGFVTRLLRQLGLELNQEGDSHDRAEGRGGGRETGDQGHSAGSGRDIVSDEEGDEYKAERAEGTSSFDKCGRISSTSNVPGERDITRRKHVVPLEASLDPTIKADFISVPGERDITRRKHAAADFISDGKSAATESNLLGKSIKSLSPG